MPPDEPARGRSGAKAVSLGATLAPAPTRRDFARAPHGRWIGGGTFVYAWPTRALCATRLFGEPGVDDLEALAALFALELVPPGEPHASYIDARRITGVDSTAFSALSEYVEAHRDDMRDVVTRLALVRPDGFVGAVTAGFYEALEPPYPVQIFEDPREALTWLGADTAWAEVLDELGSDGPALLADLRRAIVSRLPDASVETAAEDLGMTVRTLQRRLKEHDTSFRRELAAAQVEAAQRWLRDTDSTISRVAYEVGCASPQRLSVIFKRETGQTPSRWRDTERA